MGLREIVLVGVDWINLAQDMDWLWAAVHMTANFHVS
jgi:hypothetical protein